MHVPAADAAKFKLLDMSCLSASSLSSVYSSQIPVAKNCPAQGDSNLCPKSAGVDSGLSIPDKMLSEEQSVDSTSLQQDSGEGETDLEARVRDLLNHHDQQLPGDLNLKLLIGHLIPTQDPGDLMVSVQSQAADNFTAVRAARLEEQAATEVVACCKQAGAVRAAPVQDQQSKLSHIETAAEGVTAAVAAAAAIHKKEIYLAAAEEAVRNRERALEQILLEQERSYQRKESAAVAAARNEGAATLMMLRQQRAELEHRLLEQEQTQESKIRAALSAVRQDASFVWAEAHHCQVELEQQLHDMRRLCLSAAAVTAGTALATAQEIASNLRPNTSSGQGQGPAEMHVKNNVLTGPSGGDQALPFGPFTVHST